MSLPTHTPRRWWDETGVRRRLSVDVGVGSRDNYVSCRLNAVCQCRL